MNPYDIGICRPFLDESGRSMVTLTDGDRRVSVPIEETSDYPYGGFRPKKAIFAKEQWMLIDQVVLREFREAAPITCSLVDAGLVFKDFNGLSKLVFEEKVEEAPASVTAPVAGGSKFSDVVKERQTYKVTALPLPITHAPFQVWKTDEGTLLQAAAAARAVGESVDQQILKALNEACRGQENWNPTRSTYHAGLLLGEQGHWGPYRRIEDYLVQLTHDVIRMVIGLEVTPIMWEREKCPRDTDGDGNCGRPSCQVCGGDGSKLHDQMKAMCIIVPQIRRDFYDNVGVCRLSPPGERAKSTMDGL